VLGYGNVRGIDMKRFDPNRYNWNGNVNGNGNGNETFDFLFVGRIVRDKGMDELMAAFDMLSKKYPQARLVLVGRYEDILDPISQEVRDIITRNPNIDAVGPKYGDDLLAYYATADCFVFPSYREGFPNTVIEAGAMGLPCIVTDINGSREIISLSPDPSPKGKGESVEGSVLSVEGSDDEKPQNLKLKTKSNGIIIPSKDAEALYEAMEMMMTDEELRQRMASCARQMIADRFEQGFVRKCLYEFYNETL
jgi:glycosyltransferase involved in cell wall biosynthesis